MSRGRILVWGAGGHGHVVADIAEACGWEVVAFVAREAGAPVPRSGKSLPVLDGAALSAALAKAEPLPHGATAIALGVGDNAQRLAIAAALNDRDLPALIHPSVVVSPSARLGAGTVAMPNVVVNARA